jgi:hypothetical protein
LARKICKKKAAPFHEDGAATINQPTTNGMNLTGFGTFAISFSVFYACNQFALFAIYKFPSIRQFVRACGAFMLRLQAVVSRLA